MPKATLTISVEGGADAKRAFGQIAGESKKANAAIQADARRTKDQLHRNAEEEVRDALRASAAKLASEEKLQDARQRLTKQATETVAREIAVGVTEEENGARRREAIYKRLAREYVRAEQNKTTELERAERARDVIIERHHRSRSRNSRGGGGGGGEGGGSGGGMIVNAIRSVGGAVFGVTDTAAGHASNMARMAADAQEELAPIDDQLNHTLYQAAPNNAELNRRKQQLLQFAHDNDMDPAVVAQAAAEAQEKFSALGNRSDSEATRNDRMQSFMDTLSEARDFQQDPQQYARLAGALTQGGLSGTTLRQTMRSLGGISMRGGVEIGNLTAEALRPMMAEIARVQGQGPEAVQAAITRQVSMMEVLSPLGQGPLRAGNAVFDAGTALRSTRNTDNILQHIRNRFGANSALENALYTRDAHGNSTFREEMKNGLKFGQTLSQVGGMSSDDIRNMLGTETDRHTHHTIRQALLKNQREALASLAGVQDGKTGYQRLAEIQEGATLTERDRVQGHELATNSLTAKIQRARNARIFNLLDESNPVGRAMVSAGEQQRQWEADNPYKNYLATNAGIPGGMTMKAGAIGGQVLGQGMAGTAALVSLGNAPVRLHPDDIRQLGSAVGQNLPSADSHEAVHAATVAASSKHGTQGH